MLTVKNLAVKYKGAIFGVRGLSMIVQKGQCVALLGANGAGKTSTLRAIAGLLKNVDGIIDAGSIVFNNKDITIADPVTRVKNGISLVEEGRQLLRQLTVEQNLKLGGHLLLGKKKRRERLDQVYAMINRLADLRFRTAGYLSGGEQQMLVIGRAFMTNPKLLMIDEPSLGLAPLVVTEIYDILRELKQNGVTIIIVEQNIRAVLTIADHGYILKNGKMQFQGDVSKLKNSEIIKESYLGET